MKLKTCIACKKTYPESPIYFHRTGRYLESRCKDCHRHFKKLYKREYRKNRTQNPGSKKSSRKEDRQNLIFRLLRRFGCVDCGNKDPSVLEFDHVCGEKKSGVGQIITKGNMTSLRVEIRKCQIRCANCHRKRHAVENNHWTEQFIKLYAPTTS